MAEAVDEQEAALIDSGQRLRELRQAKNLSQEAVCMVASVAQLSYSEGERRGLNRLSLRKLQAVAEAMDRVIEVSLRPRKTTSPLAARASSWHH